MRTFAPPFLALLLVLLLALPAHARPILVGVVPDLPGPGEGDEAVAIADDQGQALELSGLVLSDGEGTWRIPAGVQVPTGGEAWLVGNVSLWKSVDGPAPAAQWDKPDFRLANSGDEVMLLDGDRVLDAFAYGDGRAPGVDGAVEMVSPGLVYRRLHDGHWIDTGSADDWRTPRLHRVGESALDMPVWQADVTLYLLPDAGFQVLTGLIEDARERLHLHVYDLRLQELVDALVAAKRAHPDLDLQVMVEDRPVGQNLEDRHRTAEALRRVQGVGGSAWIAGSGRYTHHHLKVLVTDDDVAVQSENWVPSGVPPEPGWGNRGWGAVVHGQAPADWFAAWMADDRAAWDTEPFDLPAYAPLFEAPPWLPPQTGRHPGAAPLRLEEVQVRPLVAPDATHDPRHDPVARRVAEARERVLVQQLDLRTEAANRLGFRAPDPLAEALAEAAQQADVRILAAGPFRHDDTGNAEALAWLAQHGVEGRLWDHPELEVLHNKAVIADDVVMLGSMNGNHHSRSQNREVSLVLEDPRAADHFARAFEEDWSTADPRDWGVVGDDLEALPSAQVPTLFAVLLVAVLLVRRCRSTSSPG